MLDIATIKTIISDTINDTDGLDLTSDVGKFTVEHVTPTLRDIGINYLNVYVGNFEFLLDLKVKSSKYVLSDGQVKGILNCIRADIRRESTISDTPKFDVADGYYAIGDCVHEYNSQLCECKLTFYVVKTSKSGNKYVSQIIGGGTPNSDGIKKYLGYNPEIFKAIESDKFASQRYGIRVGRCGRCNRLLTDIDSRTRGIGPECLKILGM